MLTLSAYGHSWVEGAGASDASRSFVQLVAGRLRVPWRNHGVGGSSTEETAAVVSSRCRSNNDLNLVMTGLNDCRLNGGSRSSESAYARSLSAIFNSLDGSGGVTTLAIAQPHLASYSMHAPYDRGSSQSIDRYNAILHSVASGYPTSVVRLPKWDSLTMLDPDTVHPNDLGHRTIADAVLLNLSRRFGSLRA